MSEQTSSISSSPSSSSSSSSSSSFPNTTTTLASTDSSSASSPFDLRSSSELLTSSEVTELHLITRPSHSSSSSSPSSSAGAQRIPNKKAKKGEEIEIVEEDTTHLLPLTTSKAFEEVKVVDRTSWSAAAFAALSPLSFPHSSSSSPSSSPRKRKGEREGEGEGEGEGEERIDYYSSSLSSPNETVPIAPRRDRTRRASRLTRIFGYQYWRERIGSMIRSTLLAIAYGLTEVPIYVTTLIKGFFQSAFLLEVAKLSPFTTAAILVVGQVLDTLIDPVIGHASDRTTSRFGRRKSWLIFGTIPFMTVWVLYWWVPPIEHYRWIYFLFVQLAITITYGAIAVPFHSWLPEIARTYDDRTFMMMFNKILSIVGGVLYSFIHALIIDAFPCEDPDSSSCDAGTDMQKGYLVSAFISAGLFGVCLTVTILFVRVEETPIALPAEDRDPTEPFLAKMKRKATNYFSQLKEIFGNKPFLQLTLTYLFSVLAVQLVQNNLLLYVQYVLYKPDLFSYFLLDIQAFAAAFVFIWAWVSRTSLGKRLTYMIGVIPWLLAEIVVFFIEEGDKDDEPKVTVIIFFILLALGGTGVGVVLLMPWAMLPDVVQYDTLMYGRQREGMMYAWFVVLQQAGLALGIGLSQFGLGAAGYDETLINPHEQPEAVRILLKLLIGPVPLVLVLLSLIPIYFYPVTRELQVEIGEQLEERKSLLEGNKKTKTNTTTTNGAGTGSSPTGRRYHSSLTNNNNTSSTMSPNTSVSLED